MISLVRIYHHNDHPSIGRPAWTYNSCEPSEPGNGDPNAVQWPSVKRLGGEREITRPLAKVLSAPEARRTLAGGATAGVDVGTTLRPGGTLDQALSSVLQDAAGSLQEV